VSHRIGVIGAGNIGSYHARTLHRRVPGAEVSAVFDVDTDRAEGRRIRVDLAERPVIG
jgi:predicted dehydrogenase